MIYQYNIIISNGVHIRITVIDVNVNRIGSFDHRSLSILRLLYIFFTRVSK